MSLRLLGDRGLYSLLTRCDADLARAVREAGCPCGGVLHSAVYPRNPRGALGGKEWRSRFSFCCAERECRKRRTPSSVRFLGRRVYVGVWVVLVAALVHGATAKRVARLRQKLEIDKRTLVRWREWWLAEFVTTPFWKVAGARFSPPLDTTILPLSLVQRFEATGRETLLKLMEFLLPLTTGWMVAEVHF